MTLRETFNGRRVLVTGHTGFKGSWLALWLTSLGAKVLGIGLDPEGPVNYWQQLALDIDDARLDIRDAAALAARVEDFRPEVVFHLAAQALVRRSYADPVQTWSTNVIGTVNLLDVCRRVSTLRAVVVATTDKCYENREWVWAYREMDRLGGRDPYSASKAAAELAVSSYRSAFFSGSDSALVASARAGNVIGGGDWSEDRLIPDIVRCAMRGETVEIRNPRATRPWQHVLESLAGYLLLAQRLMGGDATCAEAWNFGPEEQYSYSVEEVLQRMAKNWPNLKYRISLEEHVHEAQQLRVDSSKARQRLGFRSTWNLDQALDATADWYKRFLENGVVCSAQQVSAFTDAAGL